MTRRDTILMAVLINVGLLVILFATAITQSGQGETSVVTAASQPAPLAATPARSEPEDLDALVARYARILEPDADKSRAVAAPEPIASAPAVAAERAAPSQPAPAERPSQATGQDLVEITVKRGDTLEKIARANGTSVAALMQTNGLESSRLQIGDVLRVPKAQVADLVRQSSPVTAAEDDYYTIRSGDNPWVVAMKFHVPLDDLLRLNSLDEDGARKLKPGDKIRIR